VCAMGWISLTGYCRGIHVESSARADLTGRSAPHLTLYRKSNMVSGEGSRAPLHMFLSTLVLLFSFLCCWVSDRGRIGHWWQGRAPDAQREQLARRVCAVSRDPGTGAVAKVLTSHVRGQNSRPGLCTEATKEGQFA